LTLKGYERRVKRNVRTQSCKRIKAALIARTAEIEDPIATAIAISIANFLDTEALGFVDCKPGRGQ
jgi:hypothetical protein